MSSLAPEKNPLYTTADQLHPSAWEELCARPPNEAAADAGAEWDGEAFHLSLLGRVVRVAPGSRRVEFLAAPGHAVGYQRGLVATTYLSRALPVEPRGLWMTFRELPGGDGFFRGPHSLATRELERCFGTAPRRLTEAAALLGGHACDGGDAAAQLPALPRVPLRALLWAGTEEFPAAANLLIDARAYLHLPLDVLWALSNLAIADLVRNAK